MQSANFTSTSPATVLKQLKTETITVSATALLVVSTYKLKCKLMRCTLTVTQRHSPIVIIQTIACFLKLLGIVSISLLLGSVGCCCLILFHF